MARFVITDDLLRRFWSKVKKSRECWLWTGRRLISGYGTIYIPVRQYIYAHRLSYLIVNGSIPRGTGILHRCDNPPCVRPSHLFAGTQKDNVADAIKKGRWIFGDKNGSRTKPRPRANFPHGERGGAAKLTWEKALEIRSLYRTGRYSIRQLSKIFGVTAYSTIRCILIKKTWKPQYRNKSGSSSSREV